MFALFLNGVDVTDNLQKGSLSIKDQLNNRRNTANFKIFDLEVSEGQDVKIYKGASLSASFLAGVNTIKVFDLFDFYERFRVGDTVLLGIGTPNEEKKIIQSINTSTNEITFTQNLLNNHDLKDSIGKLIFAGTVQKTPDAYIGKSDLIEYKVGAADYSFLFDREVVVETFEDMYVREILSRVLFEFMPPDERLTVFEFDTLTGITESGVALTPTLDGVDRISGNNSVNIGTSGAGVATYTISLPSQIDLSTTDNLRQWVKFAAVSSQISSFKIRVGNDNLNYYEWDDILIFDNLWSYDSFEFGRGTVVGTPDLMTVDFLEFEITTTGAIALGDLKLDISEATLAGFTMRNVQNSSVIFADLRVQYNKPTVLVEKLAKNLGFFWYVDYERDLHFFAKDAQTAPYEITSNSQNYDKISVSVDLTNIKNRQTVRGGIAPSEALYVQEEITDGKKISWSLDYPPKDLKFFVDTGSGFVQKTVGVENLVDETTVDYVFNFNEKVIRAASAAVIPADNTIKIEYIPYKAIRVRTQDNESIALMKTLTGGNGVFDGAVINDESIRTFDEARKRANAEINAYKNPIIDISFKTDKEGLRAGQLLRVENSDRGIDDFFLIQSISTKSKGDYRFEFSVKASSTLFGYIEFFQLLFTQSEKLLIDVSELVDLVFNIDETLVLSDNYVFTHKDKLFYATGPTPGSTPNDGIVGFSQVA